jgi:hypothetical protein
MSANGIWQGAPKTRSTLSQKLDTLPAVIGIDIGKNSIHIAGQNQRGAIVQGQKWSRGQVAARLANLPPCRIGMEACVGAHYFSRTLTALGHDARLMPAKYVRPYRWARRQITEWQPVSDDQPKCDKCMMTSWQRLVVWHEPRA